MEKLELYQALERAEGRIMSLEKQVSSSDSLTLSCIMPAEKYASLPVYPSSRSRCKRRTLYSNFAICHRVLGFKDSNSCTMEQTTRRSEQGPGVV